MSESVRHQLVVIAVALAVFFTGLGSARLWDEDEPKNAACAREMMERGDWVVPSFNYELRTDKPVLLYWLMMAAYQVFGVTELGARFASAALAVGTTLLVYHLGRLAYRPTVGLWAAIALASSLMFDVAARAATPDSALIFFSTLAVYAFVRAGGVQGTGPGWGGWVGVYAAMGLAVLAKGPVGVVLPTGVMVLFTLCRGEQCGGAAATTGTSRIGRLAVWLARTFSPRGVAAAIWRSRPLTALAVVAVIALPWYVLVGLRTDGQWLAGFLGRHNVGRFLHAMEGHRGPIFYYLIAVIVGYFPWSVFLPLCLLYMVRRIRNGHAWRNADVFCACWAGLYIGFFSLARTKLPSYITPCYPALALLTGALFDEWLRSPGAVPRRMLGWALLSPALVGLAVAVGLPIASWLVVPGESWLGAIGLILVGGSWLAWRETGAGRIQRAQLALASMGVLFATALFGLGAARVSSHHTSPVLIAKAGASSESASPVVTYRHYEPSLIFYAQRQVAQYHTREQLQEALRAAPAARVITRSEFLDELSGALGPEMVVVERLPRFLRKGEVVLLAPAVATARRDTSPAGR